MKKIELTFCSTEEKLPEKSGDYITVSGEGNHLFVVSYSEKYKLFNEYDGTPAEKAGEYAFHDVKLWAEIPEEIIS